jgi:N-formylmaleamate deformylase
MTARGAQVRANGIRLHYLEYGAADPTVLLIPGITAPATT